MILVVKNSPKKIVFDPEKITLLLTIKPKKYAFHEVERVAKQKWLSKKKEFHITLMGSTAGEVILEKIIRNSKEKKKILSTIKELANKFSWNCSFQKKYYFISKVYPGPNLKKEERKSIIQLVNLPNLAPFYKKINRLLGTKFEIPFPHITLFTNSTRKDKRLRGIGIYSKKEFRSLKPLKI